MGDRTDGRRAAELAALCAMTADARAATAEHVHIVAIDGGAAAGKSTLADQLRASLDAAGSSCAVVRTDDLLDGWDDQFGFHQRLRDQVLTPLRGGAGDVSAVGSASGSGSGSGARYQRYDWVRGCFAEHVTVPAAQVVLVEGFSAIEACRGYADLEVYLQLDVTARARRWQARDGDLTDAACRWLDRETAYLSDLDGQALDAGTWTELPGALSTLDNLAGVDAVDTAAAEHGTGQPGSASSVSALGERGRPPRPVRPRVLARPGGYRPPGGTRAR